MQSPGRAGRCSMHGWARAAFPALAEPHRHMHLVTAQSFITFYSPPNLGALCALSSSIPTRSWEQHSRDPGFALSINSLAPGFGAVAVLHWRFAAAKRLPGNSADTQQL